MRKVKEAARLFVPGRICLFGEHSDWAGEHRKHNAAIERGYAIIAPTNQGNYARIKELRSPLFVFRSPLSRTPLKIELKKEKLLKTAEAGGIFSYVAGVAFRVISEHHNPEKKGVEIDNYRMDLPVKKGLSSSASICVLTARAFNKIFNLNLNKRGEMELAYRGEIITPSRCGRLDQACAYEKVVLMTFDCDEVEIETLKIGKTLYFLIADLKAGKDTRKILSALNEGFPFPRNRQERVKHKYLGKINRDIVFRAVKAIGRGKAEEIGRLMRKAQEGFDRYLVPACPAELRAPKLHRVLASSRVKPCIFGGKGVGSGGDGTVQFICKSPADRENLKSVLDAEFGLDCFDLDLKR